ncbi:MAG TPA: hypothetical protein VM261_08475 [Kofleriaceae bacterium]|nr:hypothetical protein [Kofleriaceae bacterium]
MTRTLFLSLGVSSIVSFGALAACNPYDPDLGSAPFECGNDEPRCPEGYTCVEYSDTNRVCEKSEGEDNTDAAGGNFQCANDTSIEPNNDVMTAFVTPIPQMPMYSLVGLAVCPTGDRDHFRFSIASNGQNFEAQVSGVASRSSLKLEVLTSAGAVVATGAPVSGTPQVVRVEIQNRLAIGDYIVRVESQDSTENNYDLTLKVCADPLPCDGQ